MELIDGHLGSPHIDSNDKAIIHRGLRGDGSFVFEWGDSCSATVQDANHIMIGTGCGSIQGLDWSVTVPETVAIDSGSQGTNRNDIIAVRYAKDTHGVQTASLAVVKGNPSSGTATDPTIPSGDVLSATEAWQPLWRIPISGITVGTPVQLFEILTPLKTVGDSVTRMLYVETITATINLNAGNHASINAPEVDGYRFIAWVASWSVGWVGATYIANPTSSSTDVYNASNVQDGNRSVYCTALYQTE